MNYPLRHRVSFLVTVACLIAMAGHTACAQTFYFVGKGQNFTQTSAAGPVAGAVPEGASNAFHFSASAPIATTLTLPNNSTQVLAKFFSGDSEFSLEQSFTTKAALDAAYPNGTYRMTGTGIPSLTFNLTTDNYPAVTPAVTGGTWNAGGMLLVNPSQATTITLATFTGYSTSGVAGHVDARIQGVFDNSDIVDTQATSVPLAGSPAAPVITSMSIPAGRMVAGRVYQGQVEFGTVLALDQTTVSGGGVVTLFTKSLTFYIAAVTSGDGGTTPVITSQPASQATAPGGTVTFQLIANVNSGPNVSLFWNFNGQPVNGSDTSKYSFNSNSLTVKNVTATDVGSYTATIFSTGGVVTSTAATLTIVAAPTPVAPTIARQPASVTVTQGSTATFGIEASGSPAPTYRWQRNGADVQATGSSGPTISIPGASATNAGTYTCIVTNSAGTATSSQATLSIATNFSDPGRLTNLSVLTDISASVPSFTLGTVVGGTGTTGTKPLVIRAVGPSLGALGVPGTIIDPKVDLLTGQTVAATNDNWNGDAGVLTAMASVGAFAFTGPTSKDAAIYSPSLASRDYTVQVSGVGGATGTVIAEIYDATPAGTFTTATPRLINVSVLKTINSGGSITLGFTVGGSSAKAILVRAIGPGLAAVGLTGGTVADPQLTLFNSSSVAIATNNDWNSDQAVSVVGTRVNAFSVGNFGAKDAMLLVTLPAGGYTARASGVGGTGGIVIVEAYEVP